MDKAPPYVRDPEVVDAEHLRLLAIFHFILAGLAAVGIGFLALHYLVMHVLLSDSTLWANPRDSLRPPRETFLIFRWFYAAFGFWLALGGLGNLISGLCIRARKNRAFSLVVAAFNCIHIPFGTVLGVFTIIVLTRSSVRSSYLE